MTGLELLELVVEKGDRTAGEYAELALEAGLIDPPADGRRFAPILERLRAHDLVSDRYVGASTVKRYTPARHGRIVLANVKRARAGGFVPYAQIDGVGLAMYVLSRAV